MDGVIHTASPFHTNFESPRELLRPAMRGTDGLLNAIMKLAPQVKRVVITSSFAAIIDPEKGNWPGHTYDENDWNPVTMLQALHGDATTTYRASKTFAEREAWNFVNEKKPNFDLVTLCPPMVYGPIINAQTLSSINTSNARIWKFLNGDIKVIEPMSNPLWVDVRDLASAHLSAYETPAAGGNRFFIVSDEWYSNQDIADVFRKVDSCSPGLGLILTEMPSTFPITRTKSLKEHLVKGSVLNPAHSTNTTTPNQRKYLVSPIARWKFAWLVRDIPSDSL